MKKILKVLNIEDSERDASLLTRHLASAGYDLVCERVETPEALRDALGRREWDVILSGYAMPGFSAFDALAIRKEASPDTPFIIISGTIGEDNAVEAMRSGASDYLMKDNLARLAPAIEREIQIAENRRAQRLAEETLKASESELRSLFAAVTDVILMLDAEGRYLKIAPTDPSYLFKPPDDLIGKRLHEVFPKEQADFFLDHIERALNEGRTQRLEYDLQIKGAEVWFDASISPVTKDSVLWIARDVTERKQLEGHLRQSQKMEAIGRLAGVVAHDFNNLLTAINGYSDLLLRRLKAEDPLRKYVGEIKGSVASAVSLTRQLLTFSRKQVPQMEVLDLNMVVSASEISLGQIIGDEIELLTALAPESGQIKADPGQIEQVLMNLVMNAKEAMPQGGKLILETKNLFLDEAYAKQRVSVKPGPYVMLAVSDTGVGIDEETRARIFEPFFTTKEKGKGTGLGLSTVYGIIKQSGGDIWVYSEVGRGTTFKVYLPRVDEVDPQDELTDEAEETSQGTGTILLVEDEEAVRNIIRRALEMHGYHVLEANGGGAALLINERHAEPIQLLITDVFMPELSGPELATRLSESRRGMKVLYMSGYTDDAIAHQGVLEREANFIQKPFSLGGLVRKVREVLSMD